MFTTPLSGRLVAVMLLPERETKTLSRSMRRRLRFTTILLKKLKRRAIFPVWIKCGSYSKYIIGLHVYSLFNNGTIYDLNIGILGDQTQAL